MRNNYPTVPITHDNTRPQQKKKKSVASCFLMYSSPSRPTDPNYSPSYKKKNKPNIGN